MAFVPATLLRATWKVTCKIRQESRGFCPCESSTILLLTGLVPRRTLKQFLRTGSYHVSGAVGALRQSCIFCIFAKRVEQRLEMSLAVDQF